MSNQAYYYLEMNVHHIKFQVVQHFSTAILSKIDAIVLNFKF